MGGTVIPDIPSAAAAVTEWTACLLYWVSARKRFSDNVSALLIGLMLGAQIFLHTHIFNWLPVSFLRESSGLGILMVRAAGLLANVLLMFAGTFLLTQYSLRVSIYLAAKAFVTAELIASAACVLYDGWVLIGWNTGWAPQALFYGGMSALYLLMMHRFIPEESRYLKRAYLSVSQVLTVILVAVTTFCISNCSLLILGTSAFISNENMLSRVMLRLIGDLCGFLILWLLVRINLEHETREELSAVKNTLNKQYQQYLNFRDTSEYIARQNHDLKHQMQELRRSASDEEREAYIGEMERVIALNEAWNVTGNSILDSILTNKKMYCIGHNIEFTCKAQAQDLNILSVRDTCSLFGNIIDNAIEYVSGFEDKSRRVVRGTVETRRSFLVIEFENCYEGPELEAGVLPATSKHDATQHGYGLKSIQYITDKYGGTMTIRTKDKWFSIRILLPLQLSGVDAR